MLEDDVDEALHEAALGAARLGREREQELHLARRASRRAASPASAPPTTGSGAVSAACARRSGGAADRRASRPCRRSSGSMTARTSSRALQASSAGVSRSVASGSSSSSACRKMPVPAPPGSSPSRRVRRRPGAGDLVEHLRRRPVAAVRLLDAAVRRRHGARPRAAQRGQRRVGFDRRDGGGLGTPGGERAAVDRRLAASSARASITYLVRVEQAARCRARSSARGCGG